MKLPRPVEVDVLIILVVNRQMEAVFSWQRIGVRGTCAHTGVKYVGEAPAWNDVGQSHGTSLAYIEKGISTITPLSTTSFC